MSNLVPERRMDINGHVKTRWVKANPTDKSNNKLLPAPILPTEKPVNYWAEIDSMLAYVAMENGDYNDPFLSEAPESTLAYIYQALMAEGDPDELHEVISYAMNERIEPHLMEAFIQLYDVHSGTMEDMEGIDYLRGALHSGTNPPEGYDRHDPERATSVANLYRFLCAFRNDLDFVEKTKVEDIGFAWSKKVKNPHLADYIIENPERLQDVIRMAGAYPQELQSRDKSGIEMLMEEARNWTPVSDGVL